MTTVGVPDGNEAEHFPNYILTWPLNLHVDLLELKQGQNADSAVL
jgi:hypothetical protein